MKISETKLYHEEREINNKKLSKQKITIASIRLSSKLVRIQEAGSHFHIGKAWE